MVNKFLNRHLTNVGSKSMVERRSRRTGRARWSQKREGDKEKDREERKRRTGGRAGWREGKQGRMKETERKQGGRAGGLDSPPLGLISFCILCCVPAK